MIRVNLPSHEHPLYPTPWVRGCDHCGRRGGYHKDGYRCYECYLFLHKECAESPLQINHPSHRQHPLYLISARTYNNMCKLCGYRCYTFYHCSICNFIMDKACVRTPPPDVIEFPKSHQHSLVLEKDVLSSTCDLCEEQYGERYPYKCSQCELLFHFECSNFPKEIIHPCHPRHPVRLIKQDEHHFSDGMCCLCGIKLKNNFYYCSICKFSIDVGCVRDPPPLSILFTKAHEHQLNIMPRNISFTCDACGMNGTRSPYSCHQCGFMVHQDCIDLPEIININRHEHRLLKRLHLSPGSWVCGVCHKEVDWSYGAYSCSICSNYVVHSICATRFDVWDKLELKGIPEEIEDIEPFKTVHGDLICHFSHEEHYLKLNEENIVRDGNLRCAACVLPIYFQEFYSCVQCDFILHKACASLPRKKRHVSYDKPLTLICCDIRPFECSTCSNYSVGFRYTNFKDVDIDVICGALSESIIHDSHPCHLYYMHGNCQECDGCGTMDIHDSYFSCEDCKFMIDFKCVILPKITEHWYDEHPLSLCYEKNMSDEVWCDICENKIDTILWFYKCDDCRVTFHTKCVIGDFSHFLSGRYLSRYSNLRFEVMQTKPGFVPRCRMCHSQRAVPIVLKLFKQKQYIFVCSSWCLYLAQ